MKHGLLFGQTRGKLLYYQEGLALRFVEPFPYHYQQSTMPKSKMTYLTILIDLIDEARKRGWLKKIVDVFKNSGGSSGKSSISVIVLGSTGAGKTNFIESLKTTGVPEAINRMNRTQRLKSHKIPLDNELFNIIDTPGQIGHQDRRMDAIRQAIREGATGVINVVSYGYHEYKVPPDNLFDANGKVGELFLEQHRKTEIDLVSEWSGLLGDPATTPWLITVVTKADLWWDRHDEVIEYYETGPYYQALGTAKNLKPIVKPWCSVFSKFYGTAPMAGLVEDKDRATMRTNLVFTMGEAAAVGQEH